MVSSLCLALQSQGTRSAVTPVTAERRERCSCLSPKVPTNNLHLDLHSVCGTLSKQIPSASVEVPEIKQPQIEKASASWSVIHLPGPRKSLIQTYAWHSLDGRLVPVRRITGL